MLFIQDAYQEAHAQNYIPPQLRYVKY
ncbi:uncharacterized protein METZ01_LOCUS167579 [marine metagenome]|uniref:Uncharacterized protein n=1 Tax=marine metagenome TaxID=408172 RepID=A0A382BLQ8_9ZZZZ